MVRGPPFSQTSDKITKYLRNSFTVALESVGWLVLDLYQQCYMLLHTSLDTRFEPLANPKEGVEAFPPQF